MSISGEPTTKVWYCKQINRVRVASTPGGAAYTVEEARELQDEIEAAIAEAEADG